MYTGCVIDTHNMVLTDLQIYKKSLVKISIDIVKTRVCALMEWGNLSI